MDEAAGCQAENAEIAAGGRHVGTGQPPGLECKKAAGDARLRNVSSAARVTRGQVCVRFGQLLERHDVDEAAGRHAENAGKAGGGGHVGAGQPPGLEREKAAGAATSAQRFFMHGRVCARCGRRSGAMTTKLRVRNEKLNFLARRCLESAIHCLSFEGNTENWTQEKTFFCARPVVRPLRPKERAYED